MNERNEITLNEMSEVSEKREMRKMNEGSDANEMSEMKCNFFSIDTNIVVSEKSFIKLNSWLRDFDILVEEINYKEISKQGGLLRCSTLPLIRE